MSIKRIVDTSFWTDDKVVDTFSPEDKLFFLYLMTNPHTKQLGVYHLPKKIMAFEIGYSRESIEVLLDRFENAYGVIRYNDDTQEVAIKNYLKYSVFGGGKPFEDCLTKEITLVKDKSLITWCFDELKRSTNLNQSVFNIVSSYTNDKYNDNDNDNERLVPRLVPRLVKDGQNNREKAKEIILYLNEKTGKAYRDCETNLLHIVARLNEGYSVEDFKTVIDKKVNAWKYDIKMCVFLRPETLFCKTHFESYLNETETKTHSFDVDDFFQSAINRGKEN